MLVEWPTCFFLLEYQYNCHFLIPLGKNMWGISPQYGFLRPQYWFLLVNIVPICVPMVSNGPNMPSYGFFWPQYAFLWVPIAPIWVPIGSCCPNMASYSWTKKQTSQAVIYFCQRMQIWVQKYLKKFVRDSLFFMTLIWRIDDGSNRINGKSTCYCFLWPPYGP